MPASSLDGAKTLNSSFLDFLFEGLALVPWLPNDEEGRKRRDSMGTIVAPKLREQGWDVKRETLVAVWKGERDRARLLVGLDGASAAAVHAILSHAERAENRLGKPARKMADETFEWLK